MSAATISKRVEKQTPAMLTAISFIAAVFFIISILTFGILSTPVVIFAQPETHAVVGAGLFIVLAFFIFFSLVATCCYGTLRLTEIVVQAVAWAFRSVFDGLATLFIAGLYLGILAGIGYLTLAFVAHLFGL